MNLTSSSVSARETCGILSDPPATLAKSRSSLGNNCTGRIVGVFDDDNGDGDDDLLGM